MAGLQNTGKNVLVLLVLLFGNYVLMSSAVQDAAGLSLVERAVLGASGPGVDTAGRVGGAARGLHDGFQDVRRAFAENERLRLEVERLREEVTGLREQAEENRRLRRLLQLRDDLAPRSLAARVVTARLDDQSRMIVVDRGTDGGVREDQAVVGWGGAVGRVVFADKQHAKVRLLSDPNSGVAGLVQRTRVEGILLGAAEGGLDMTYVPSYADVAIGDRVVTSGLDGIFPKGFGIGRVVEIPASAGATKRIRVRPEVDPAHLEEVLILTEPLGGGLLDQPEAEPAP